MLRGKNGDVALQSSVGIALLMALCRCGTDAPVRDGSVDAGVDAAPDASDTPVRDSSIGDASADSSIGDSSVADSSVADSSVADSSVDSSVDSSDDAADAAPDPCLDPGTLRACVSAIAVIDCATGIEERCSPSTTCRDWSPAADVRNAACVSPFLFPCDHDEDDAPRCEGTARVGECIDAIPLNPNDPPRFRRGLECTSRWPDATCVREEDESRCVSPSAAPCASGLLCSSDGRARLRCSEDDGILYEDPCSPEDECVSCGSAGVCIWRAAVEVEGDLAPRTDRLRCTTPASLRLRRCGREWTARCNDDDICHDFLDGSGADCFDPATEFCDTPGEQSCADDLGIARRCSERGTIQIAWCAGSSTICDRSTLECYPEFEPCLTPDACVAEDEVALCETNPFDGGPELHRYYCPEGCTEEGGRPVCR